MPNAKPSSNGALLQLFLWGGLVLLIGGWLIYQLSFDKISGYPDSSQKSVTIYQQAASNPAGLSVFLHPPLDSIQTADRDQYLAFQFINRGPSSVQVIDLQLSSLCLRLAPDPQLGGTAQTPPFKLEKDQSIVSWYKLSVADSSDHCLRQSPLVFRYAWQLDQPRATKEWQSISTGPVLVTTPQRMGWERVFSLTIKFLPLILGPILLWLYQHGQKGLEEKKSDLQKQQEQRLEIWKAILPAFIEAVRKYYVPMLSIISVMTSETGKQNPADADLDEVLAGALLLRNKFTSMIWHNGGFYFKNLVGEQLCTIIFDDLMDRCYLLAGDKDSFRAVAEALPDDSTPRAVKEIVRRARANSPLVAMRSTLREKVAADANVLKGLNSHLNSVAELITYEANVPLYPWYEAPYKLNKDNLKSDELGLDAKTKRTLDDYVAEIEKAFDDYVKSLDRAKSSGAAPPAAP